MCVITIIIVNRRPRIVRTSISHAQRQVRHTEVCIFQLSTQLARPLKTESFYMASYLRVPFYEAEEHAPPSRVAVTGVTGAHKFWYWWIRFKNQSTCNTLTWNIIFAMQGLAEHRPIEKRHVLLHCLFTIGSDHHQLLVPASAVDAGKETFTLQWWTLFILDSSQHRVTTWSLAGSCVFVCC